MKYEIFHSEKVANQSALTCSKFGIVDPQSFKNMIKKPSSNLFIFKDVQQVDLAESKETGKLW